MPSTISPRLEVPDRSLRSRAQAGALRSARCGRRGSPSRRRRTLRRYVDRAGRLRQVIAQPAREGTVLVVDCDAATLADRRLVAHLAADEPSENAMLVCASYLDQVRLTGCRCRPLTEDDLAAVPFSADDEPASELSDGQSPPVDRSGAVYRLRAIPGELSVPELRWGRHGPAPMCNFATVSLREAITALESYEPLRALTISALACLRASRAVSTVVLQAELTRVQLSPIVLNRGLREAVLQRIEREGLSMSEIAVRCGRIKRGGGAAETGETSWLARRLGLLPEGGKSEPTPWIHSDVLALIARRGLGVSPREVEL